MQKLSSYNKNPKVHKRFPLFWRTRTSWTELTISAHNNDYYYYCYYYIIHKYLIHTSLKIIWNNHLVYQYVGIQSKITYLKLIKQLKLVRYDNLEWWFLIESKFIIRYLVLIIFMKLILALNQTTYVFLRAF